MKQLCVNQYNAWSRIGTQWQPMAWPVAVVLMVALTPGVLIGIPAWVGSAAERIESDRSWRERQIGAPKHIDETTQKPIYITVNVSDPSFDAEMASSLVITALSIRSILFWMSTMGMFPISASTCASQRNACKETRSTDLANPALHGLERLAVCG